MLFEDTGVGIIVHCISAARSKRIDKKRQARVAVYSPTSFHHTRRYLGGSQRRRLSIFATCSKMVELVQSGSEVSLRSTFAKEAAFQVCLRAFAPQRETGLLTET